MKYRKFGRLDWKASVLGFGAMRLPVQNKDASKVDEAEAIKMIRYAIDHGVNYIDSGYRYHNGKSEVVVGKALKNGYREKVKIATKLPPPLVSSAKDFDLILNEQLKRLQDDKIDFYLLHGLRGNEWERLRDLGYIKWAEGEIADGRIGHLGFSFHDDYKTFKKIVDDYDNWTFCQIQYNYMDENFQAGTRGLKYAHKKGLAVVVMEPVRGGKLSRPTEAVTAIWAKAPVQRTPAEWALRWVWNHPEVTLALSGVNNMEQVVENTAIAGDVGPNQLTAEEMALIKQVRDTYRSLQPISCTGCKYCMPCPSGVDIPEVFTHYNDATMYNAATRSRTMYQNMFKEESRGDKCTKCDQCLEECPQKLPIPELLEKAHEFLMVKK